jgi:uncharacterized protein YjbI with pentapeptide repeats
MSDVHELGKILLDHRKWLRGDGGKRANLGFANLSGADLSFAYLRDANLRGADLRFADLRGADLRDANLRGANLRGANLRGADLRDADLSFANLRDANLSGADLSFAYLRGTDLRDADLSFANLRGAYLRDADLRGANLDGVKTNYRTIGIHPAPEGELIGWGKKNERIVKLLIPKDARRLCATTRKFRAEYARVLEIDGADEVTVKNKYATTTYRVGEIVRCHQWDDDRWNECGGGIHFFLTREEAEMWQV